MDEESKGYAKDYSENSFWEKVKSFALVAGKEVIEKDGEIVVQLKGGVMRFQIAAILTLLISLFLVSCGGGSSGSSSSPSPLPPLIFGQANWGEAQWK